MNRKCISARASLLLVQDPTNTADAIGSVRTTMKSRRDIAAESFELRATTVLARLLEPQGKREDARAMLSDIYNWFTEGFDTADLKDAKGAARRIKPLRIREHLC